MTSTLMAPRGAGRPTDAERAARGPVTTTVNAAYLRAIRDFTTLLSDAQTEDAEGSATVLAYVESGGRVWDKIMCVTMNRGTTHGEAEARYFVNRENGLIFGAKSMQAPNLRQFRGTVFTAKLWTWNGRLGTPKDEDRAQVRLVRTYGDFALYEPTDAETMALLNIAEEAEPTPAPRAPVRRITTTPTTTARRDGSRTTARPAVRGPVPAKHWRDE